jgi:ferric-dicitrate binding protein FerR (iron transport regulator)
VGNEDVNQSQSHHQKAWEKYEKIWDKIYVKNRAKKPLDN